jgi:hypothetical protein
MKRFKLLTYLAHTNHMLFNLVLLVLLLHLSYGLIVFTNMKIDVETSKSL